MHNKKLFLIVFLSLVTAPFLLGAQHLHEKMEDAGNQNPFVEMMDMMMTDMDAVPVKCCLNMNFLAQMSAHHQGAIKMAEYEVKHGKNKEMIQLAKKIISEQKSELAEMNTMLDYFQSQPDKVQMTREYEEAMAKTMTDMMDNMPQGLTKSSDTDVAFAEVMIPHHQAAIDMSVALMNFNADPHLIEMAKNIIAAQQVEINQMKSFLASQKEENS